jgi:hypothetical protein
MLKECRELRETNVQESIGGSIVYLHPMQAADLLVPYIQRCSVPILKFWGSVAAMSIKEADHVIPTRLS